MRRTTAIAAVLAAPLLLGSAARGESPSDLAQQLAVEARRAQPGFAGFSAERGHRFFTARHGGDWSCATCHGADPRTFGEHAVTGKRIQPLAPAANPKRFTDPAKVAKWFRRNCRDVLDRECTALEKGDVLAWLTSVEK